MNLSKLQYKMNSYFYYTDYYIFFMFVFCSIFLSILMFFLTFTLSTGTFTGDFEKRTTYECGFDPIDSSDYYKDNTDLNFYKVGILFIIFDVEILFLIPFFLIIKEATYYNFLIYTSFMWFIITGLALETKFEIFKWENQKIE